MPSISGGRPRSSCRPYDVALPQQAPDRSRGDPGNHRHRANVEAELRQQARVTCRAATEAEVLADHDHLGADPSEDGVAELRRVAPGKLRSELDDEHLVDAGVLQQLQAPLERGKQLHVIAEHEPRMRPERDHRHGPPRVEGSVEHAPMAEMHSVEAADGSDAPVGLELFQAPRNLHSRASASSAGMNRSGSASSTEKGPISVRRSVRQCPPSTSAIART